MKNYLVITLGTREIQLPLNKIEDYNFEVIEEKGEKFSKFFIQKIKESTIRIEVKQPSMEFPDFYTISPRTIGKIIFDNYVLFRPIIDFPIVRPVLEYLKQKEVKLDVIMLIYTDQEKAFKSGKVKYQNKENDSLYYADIISKLIKEDDFYANSEIDQFAITDNVTDLGYQYDDFKRINHSLLYPDEVKEVFLYPQGGIDQINQALILRLIETFKGKVKQLQKAEGADFKDLDFPAKFLNSLNKLKILKHLDDYDFDKAYDLFLEDNWIKKLCGYVSMRLNLDTQNAVNYLNEFNSNDKKFIGEQVFNDLYVFGSKSSRVLKSNVKLKDLTTVFSILCYQQKYNDALIKFFTICENLFKSLIENELHLTKDLGDFHIPEYSQNDKNESWESFLNNLNPMLLNYLKEKNIWVHNPNRKAYYMIFEFLLNQKTVSCNLEIEKLDNINNLIEALSQKRNGIAHRLTSINKDEFEKITNKYNYTIETLIEEIVKLVGIQNRFQNFELIKNLLKEHLIKN